MEHYGIVREVEMDERTRRFQPRGKRMLWCIRASENFL